jgi:hypothetical protein
VKGQKQTSQKITGGTCAYPVTLKSKYIYVPLSGKGLIPSSDILIFLMSHFIFFENTYILKMFSL